MCVLYRSGMGRNIDLAQFSELVSVGSVWKYVRLSDALASPST
jgi:hypothetical protein